MATDAGHPGRANEDFAGAVADGLVLVDGAGGIADAARVCHHGVTWYATRLGGGLLGALSLGHGLREVLAEGIERVTDEHRDTCDVADPISPFAAVAMLRFVGGRVEHLVLGDAVVVLGRVDGEPFVAHDPREVVIARSVEQRLQGVPRAVTGTGGCWVSCGRSGTARVASGLPRTTPGWWPRRSPAAARPPG